MLKLALAPLVAVLAVATSTPAAASFISELPACTGSIDLHVNNGCRMRANWFAVPSDRPGTERLFVSAQRDVVGRALVPVGANLLGDKLTYVVTFRAKDTTRPLEETLAVRAYAGDDRAEVTGGELDIISRSISADPVPLVTLEIAGARVAYQPHYLYVEISRPNIRAFGQIAVEDLQMGIVPTVR